MKKIASLFASLKVGGGVEKVQANLSLGLVDAGYDFIHIVCDDLQPRNEFGGKIISMKTPFVVGFGLKKIFSLFVHTYKVLKICKKEHINILIGQGDYFFMVSGLAKLFGFKGKTIAVVHTTISIWSRFVNRALRFFLSLHDKIVLISKEEYNVFVYRYGFKKKKMSIIYNAIDISKIDELMKENVDDISFDKFTFINIGRLNYQKGQDRLLEAFDMFHNKNSNSQLIILGDGELKQCLYEQKKSLKSNEDIHFLGNKTNVYKYLKKSDCFVLSSNFEGFGLVLIEAMACKIPIITTDCPSGPSEIVNGIRNLSNIKITENAIMVPYKENTTHFLYTAMKEIYNNQQLRKKFSDNNLKRAKDFSIDNIIMRRDSLIKSL